MSSDQIVAEEYQCEGTLKESGIEQYESDDGRQYYTSVNHTSVTRDNPMVAHGLNVPPSDSNATKDSMAFDTLQGQGKDILIDHNLNYEQKEQEEQQPEMAENSEAAEDGMTIVQDE